MIRNILNHVAIIVLLLISPNRTCAQTILSQGDIAIIGISSEGTDDFHFVLLCDIDGGTEIRFSDSGIHSNGSFRGNEGAVKYTAPSSLSAGTVICFTENNTDFISDGDASVGSGSISLSQEGDQLFVFQGSSDSPNFIFGIQTNSNIWQTDAISSNTSALPTGLTNSLNAVAVGSGAGDMSEYDNSSYDMSVRNGSSSYLLTSIANNSKWIGNNAEYYPPSGSFFVGTDLSAPDWITEYPKLENILDTRADLHVKLNEPGIVYYMILPDASIAPTSQQVKDGLGYPGTVILRDSLAVPDENTDYMEVLACTLPETAYDIYVVAEDIAPTPNLQTTPVLLEATTTALRILIITSPIEEEVYAVGTTVTFKWTSANIDSIYIGGIDYRTDEIFILGDDETDEPYVIDASLGQYDFDIPNDAATDSLAIMMWDVADTTVNDIITPVYISDNIAPGIDETWPLNNAINTGSGAMPEIFFEEPVFEGTGTLYIRNENGSIFESFDISEQGTDQGLEIFDDNYGLKIRPASDFLSGSKYYIEMDAGIVKDYFDNSFTGISGNSVWGFTIALTTESEEAISSTVKIYPVPASTELFIENIMDIQHLRIIDITGRIIISQNHKGQQLQRIPLSDFQQGVYFIILSGNNKTITRRFIKN